MVNHNGRRSKAQVSGAKGGEESKRTILFLRGGEYHKKGKEVRGVAEGILVTKKAEKGVKKALSSEKA